MAEPWFERWGGVGYRPTTTQGRFVLWAMMLCFFGAAVIALLTESSHPFLSDLATIFAAASGIVGHVVIFRRMDW